MVTDVRLAQAALDAATASGLPVWLGLSMHGAGGTEGEYDSLPDIDGARAVAEACLSADLDAVTVMQTDIDDTAAGTTRGRRRR